MNSPFIKIPILSHNDSASWIEWVVNIIALLIYWAEEARMFQRYLLEMGSTPADGSSKNNNEGFPINEIQTQSFLLFPPLKVPALWFLYS